MYKGNDKIARKFVRNCLSGLPQQVIALVLKGAGNMHKRFCLNGAIGTSELFANAECGNTDMEHDHQYVIKKLN